ncbi:bifunctional transcriptional activator/DNA repair enzyme AdaA [Corallincola spongiicola]|uniref:Methylated-DNA--protein-cysteine methyltransferase n=1 Tax=Corallincola spongiicola TaxID=2520508 RepID=A0ABY1WL62_9GAMM|nr:methylated-DNA--[protein]-cysteine S-methyltransferase [Corallincola spongiicola]TAA41052.1 methylated-DNA--[protein]-cysteine S-methyltransferase [Corallincola spongiicola]
MNQPLNELTLSEDEMYQAICDRDTRYEGQFLIGVKTTGIFCRPGCRAKTPKRENIAFFADAALAANSGFRPCKICRPLAPADSPPEWLKPLLERLHQQPDIRFKDFDLKQMGISPERVRRWFQKHHKMSFQAYQRATKMGQALGQLSYDNTDTQSVIDTAFSLGYESLSGFQQAFKKQFDLPPTKTGDKTLITLTRIPTVIGPLLAGATEQGICLLEFVDRWMLATQLKRLTKRMNGVFAPGDHPLFGPLKQQLDEYFSGQRKQFDLPLVMNGTPFQQRVWQQLMTIPSGTTRSYSEQAQAIGQPTATRAVAKANGDNMLAILVPCHRVIGANGALTGYGGGLPRKRFLLNLEGVLLAEMA